MLSMLQSGEDLVEKRFDLRLAEDLENYWNRLDYICSTVYASPHILSACLLLGHVRQQKQDLDTPHREQGRSLRAASSQKSIAW